MKTRRTLLTALASLTALGVLTACGSGEAATNEVRPEGKKGNGINLSPEQNRVHTAKVDAIAAKLPAAVRERGTLVLGVSASSNPPLAFRATDDKTLIGVEVDIATLVADALGLKPEFNAVSWENLFVGLDSGKYDGVFSNVTVTEERKDKYDFATYRLDDL
ncbi:transporter substrate-binding domain-containing protein, partial [Streptomyces sp. NPDC006324]